MILESERTREALAQIFEGIQTEYSAVQMGDYESIDKLRLKLTLSEESKQHTSDWLASVNKVMRDTTLDHDTVSGALAILISDADRAQKDWTLFWTFIRPVINRCLQQ